MVRREKNFLHFFGGQMTLLTAKEGGVFMLKRCISLLLIFAAVICLLPEIIMAEATSAADTKAADKTSYLFFDFSATDDYSGSQYGGWTYNVDKRWAPTGGAGILCSLIPRWELFL